MTTIVNSDKEYIEQLQNDLNSLRVEVINYQKQTKMLMTQVQALQAERAQREKTITKDVLSVMENNLLIREYINGEIELIQIEAKKQAREELNEKANSI